MKVNSHLDLYLLTGFMLIIAIGSLFVIQEFSPETYNDITGNMVTVGTTVNITPGIIYNCSVPVVTGMNLVSFNCIGTLQSITTVINDFSNLEGIFGYDPSSSDPWKAYKVDKPAWTVNDLSTLSKSQGYWLKANGSDTFIFSGVLSFSNDISLIAGYQLVGYPDNETENITITFENTSVSKVVGHNAGTTTFLIYVPNGSGNTLEYAEEAKGYWVNGTTSETWVVS